ncbi:hypothetical protein HNR19_002361 [Nocardioides thalensis]|uniref:site-specific DNA-methyltransferase (adenine-specific) n=1 Tax=Nocardioides thalensis TaxID=1914755 RepID=A0A853C5Y7_9ACTN|nr:hypothetical protein [Nocardioides thalensis]
MDERERAEELAAAYEARLAADRDGRRAKGAFYTPPELVSWVLDRAVPPGARRVLDPACGTGHFLVAAARIVGVAGVFGSDLDAEAVAIARQRLAAEDPSVPVAQIERQVRVADGLTAWTGETFDAVVGNPPFLGQLKRGTAAAGARAHGLGAYTDTSAVFLHRSLDLVADGGTVALVQPLSVLAARDAAKVRTAVAGRGRVGELWVSEGAEFAGAAVRTCVPVVRVGEPGGQTEWGRLAAPHFGIPEVEMPRGTGVLGDLAACTADFRDQYYGLVPHVRDGGDGAPLVTTGLLEPGACEWGMRPTRFARRSYAAPVVDVAGLRAADARLGAWADARLVPKVVVAGQGRVIEAAADEHGAWLPSVPVVSVVPHDPADVWRVLAVLLAPPVVADAAARYLGAGLVPGSVKVSARQIAALPLPADETAWREGAALARAALLEELAGVMSAAYGCADPAVARWWLDRARRT